MDNFLLIPIKKLGVAAQDPIVVYIQPKQICLIEQTNAYRGTKRVYKIYLEKDFGYNHPLKDGIKTSTSPEEIYHMANNITRRENTRKSVITCPSCGHQNPINKLVFDKDNKAICGAKKCKTVIYTKKNDK